MTQGVLVSHDWDRWGSPPPIGGSYESESAAMLLEGESIMALIETADAQFEEADRLQQEADDENYAAESNIREAESRLPSLPPAIAAGLRKRLDEYRYR